MAFQFGKIPKSTDIWRWQKRCFQRFWLIGRRKGSVQRSPLGTIHPISSKCTISCERHRAPIALSFVRRFRFSDPPVHNISEQLFYKDSEFPIPLIGWQDKNSCLKFYKNSEFLIPQDFRTFKNSDLPVHNLSEQNSHLFIILNALRISDPYHLTGQKRLSVHGSKSIQNFWTPFQHQIR